MPEYFHGRLFATRVTKYSMNTTKVAERLAELCRKGEFETAQKELFAELVVSIEP